MPTSIKVGCVGFFKSRVRLLWPGLFRVVELLILATKGTVILLVLIGGILFIELLVGLNVGLLEIVVILDMLVPDLWLL